MSPRHALLLVAAWIGSSNNKQVTGSRIAAEKACGRECANVMRSPKPFCARCGPVLTRSQDVLNSSVVGRRTKVPLMFCTTFIRPKIRRGCLRSEIAPCSMVAPATTNARVKSSPMHGRNKIPRGQVVGAHPRLVTYLGWKVSSFWRWFWFWQGRVDGCVGYDYCNRR